MKVNIQVDKEGKELITSLCDTALRVNGIKNLPGVSVILAGTRVVDPPKKGTDAPVLEKGE